MVKLSILICTLPERTDKLKKLFEVLLPQCKPNDTEVRIDNTPEIHIGAKRNNLINNANGDYCCFVDDDDLVSDVYVKSILDNLGKDCVGIEGIISFNGQFPRKFIHSIEIDRWYTNGCEYYRPPNHLNPIRTDIVKRVMFNGNCSFGEDLQFAKAIRPLLKTENMIDYPIYYYLYKVKPGECLP